MRSIMVFIFLVYCFQTVPGLLLSKPNFKKDGLVLLNSLAKNFPMGEKRLRMNLLNKARTLAYSHNIDPSRTYNMGLNKFSLMTNNEKKLYLGLANNTLSDPDFDVMRPALKFNKVAGTKPLPSSFDHRIKGHVTAVKDQQSCGSCWAFAGVGAFEGSYSIATGITKSFSDKEALDCSYPPEKNGCKGGWFTSVWRYIKDNGRLGTMREIPYYPKYSNGCKWGSKDNGIKNADYISYYRVGTSDHDIAKIVSLFNPAVALTVQDDMFKYRDGVYDGCPGSPKRVNHAIILVGYDTGFWIAKNSWGSDWGEKGYIKITRTRSNVCRVASYVTYPVVIYRDKGEKDEGDMIPENELENIARGKIIVSDPGDTPAGALVDGVDDSCHCTQSSLNPKIRLDLGKEYKIQKIELVSNMMSSLEGSKIHIGNRGDFLDKRVTVIQHTDDEVVTIQLEQAVFGSKVYLEYYGHMTPRALKLCEIKVYGKAENSDTDGCPAGTVKCPDKVCRHSHMC